MAHLILTQCYKCEVEFERPTKHINRNKKLGCKNYCSVSCAVNYPRKKTLLSIRCLRCSNIFERELKCVNRNNQRGSKNYCSRKCSSSAKSKLYRGRDNPNYGNHKLAGKNNPNYRDGRTPQNVKERNSPENKQFIKDMLRRDNFTCVICGESYNMKMVVDHIMPWSLYPELRQDPKNVRTLCKPCHKKYGADPRCKPIKWAISPINNV